MIAIALGAAAGCAGYDETHMVPGAGAGAPGLGSAGSSGEEVAAAGSVGSNTAGSNTAGASAEASAGGPNLAAACEIPPGSDPDSAATLACLGDYAELASEPADASIPGATSVKVVIDRADHDRLYFQNSKRYCIHWDFASTHLSGGTLPIVQALAQFNQTEYYSPDRRFILGALSHYAGPDRWVYEISPYDTADEALIETAFDSVRKATWLGDALTFHPTSVHVEEAATRLPADVPITTTDELYAGIDYQPLNPGRSTGILRFRTAEEVDGQYTPFREIVVLDSVPNDISIVAGQITAEFQTPLAHINVLSVNRGTPNMALRGALESAELRALEGKWVELSVGPFTWSIHEISAAAADAWWAEHAPSPLVVQPMDLSVTDLREVSAMLDRNGPLGERSLGESIQAAIPVFGAKATNYGALAGAQGSGAFDALPEIDRPGPIAAGFGVPMFYYDQFMRDNGLYARIEELMSDPSWSDPVYRAEGLRAFKDELRAAPMRPEVVEAVVSRAAELFPGENIRFRSSTNSEDLGQFTGAGLYNSETGVPAIGGAQKDSVEWAIKKVWSQVWNPRAYEEREFYSMHHLDVGMALLVHANFPDEEAQGVAITNNPFDTSGLEPAFYVNGQVGNNDVVTPDRGVLPESYLQYFTSPGQPIVYTQHSSLVQGGGSVLSLEQTHRLGIALDAIHKYFYPAYGAGGGWYALEVDWKFDDKRTPGAPSLFIKQARPYPRPQVEAAGGCQPAP
jgi:pyruvate phosphate dikinase-like enzyme